MRRVRTTGKRRVAETDRDRRSPRVAGDGVVSRQRFSAAIVSSPSRAGLLTGESPHTTRMHGFARRGRPWHRHWSPRGGRFV